MKESYTTQALIEAYEVYSRAPDCTYVTDRAVPEDFIQKRPTNDQLREVMAHFHAKGDYATLDTIISVIKTQKRFADALTDTELKDFALDFFAHGQQMGAFLPDDVSETHTSTLEPRYTNVIATIRPKIQKALDDGEAEKMLRIMACRGQYFFTANMAEQLTEGLIDTQNWENLKTLGRQIADYPQRFGSCIPLVAGAVAERRLPVFMADVLNGEMGVPLSKAISLGMIIRASEMKDNAHPDESEISNIVSFAMAVAHYPKGTQNLSRKFDAADFPKIIGTSGLYLMGSNGQPAQGADVKAAIHFNTQSQKVVIGTQPLHLITPHIGELEKYPAHTWLFETIETFIRALPIHHGVDMSTPVRALHKRYTA